MSDPAVSVVLPVRNGARFLPEAMDSILAQTLGDFEVTAVDDGSSDETPALLAAYQERDSRVRVLRTEGEGLVAALNLGCHSAGAPYIARMDADDVAAPERLERQLAYLSAHPDVALLGTGHTEIDDAGALLGTTVYPTEPDAVAARLLRKNCLAHPTVVFSRTVFDEVGGYRRSMLHGEDYDLWLRIADRHRVANLPEPLLAYRVHAQGVSIGNRRQQIISMLGAQAAARRRRAGGDDGLWDVDVVTVAVLERLGVDAAEVARNVFAACSAEAERALAAGDAELAARFCSEALDCGRTIRLSRDERAHVHRIAAIAAFDEGRLLAAARSFASGVAARPTLVGGPVRKLTRRLANRPGRAPTPAG